MVRSAGPQPAPRGDPKAPHPPLIDPKTPHQSPFVEPKDPFAVPRDPKQDDPKGEPGRRR